MDREEYRLRTDEIKALVRDRRYPEAVRIADSIDWKRVKSLKMLCMIGDLYKMTGDLEKSRNAMLLAYDKDPSNPDIVYSLCELAIKLGDLIGSVEYMKEYARLAPGEAGIYILRYKLYEEQGVSLDERAELLEEYQSFVFKPKWAYELASLYHGIGDEPRLIGECDAIFDHFAGDMKPSSHRYVLKTLELKELHTPLSPAQQSYLDSARAAEQLKREAEEAERRRLEEEERAKEAAKLAAEEERERWVAEKRAARAAGAKTGRMRTDTAGMSRSSRTVRQGEASVDTAMYAPVQQMTVPLQQAAAQQALLQQAPRVQEALDGATTVFSPVKPEAYASIGATDSPTRVLPEVPSTMPAQQAARINQEQGQMTQAYTPVMNMYDSDHLQQELARNIQDVMPDNGYEQEVFTGYHPNPYEKPKSQQVKQQTGHRGAIRHKQRRYDNMLSLEGDGQISLVLPEDEVIERQITGQISIDDIMERIRNYSKEAQEARVEQIVRGRTDGMFNSFERQAKEGPQMELDKMLGLDRVTARDVAREQEKKVSLISRPAVAAVIRPEMSEDTALSDRAHVITPEKDATVETDEMKAVTVETVADSAQESKEKDVLKEIESARRARVETTTLNLNMGTAESASALETARAGMRSEKSATAIETADSTTNSEKAATALETNETIVDSAKAAMALANVAAAEVTSGAAASTAGTIAGAGVMTVGAQIAVKSTGIPAYLLSGEEALKQKEEEQAQQQHKDTAVQEKKADDSTVKPTSQQSADVEKAEEDQAGIPAYLLSAEIRPEKIETDYAEEHAEEAPDSTAKDAGSVNQKTDGDAMLDQDVQASAENEQLEPTEEDKEDLVAATDEQSEHADEPAEEDKEDIVATTDEQSEHADESAAADKKDIDPETDAQLEPVDKTAEEEHDPAADVQSKPVHENVKEDDSVEPNMKSRTVMETETSETDKTDKTDKTDEVDHSLASDEKTAKEIEEEPVHEEAHVPSETSNVSSDTAEFEAIRVENQEEVRKLSDEELSARVEAMSEAEREQYGHILHNHMILRQILVAADELSERAKFGVVVLGKDNGLTLDIAKGLVRSSTKEYKTFTGKAAKIKGADLKAQKVPDFFKQLHNGALIITGAGRINKEASEALSRAMHENARFTMVILTDTDKHIRDLMNREPSLEELFKVKVDTEIAGGDDSLVAYGKEYAREREYSIDNLGTLALHSRIEEMQTFEYKVTTEDVKAIVDEAIENSSKRKFSHFVDVLSHKRYDDEDMIILREKDFLRP